jgi:nucleoid-associated protein YgaU
MVDNTKVASGTADANGKFVTQFNVAPSDKPRVVTLQESRPDGSTVASTDSVIIAPTAPAAHAAAAPTAEASTAAPTAAATTTAEATTPPAAAPTATADATTTQPAPKADAATAPAVLLAGKTGVTVLQPGGANAGPSGSVGIDSISYPDTGAVQLSGHGSPNASVRVYLNNAPVQTATITSDGKWQMNLPNVDPGIYTLRADQLDANGKVTSRFETPFKREAPEALAAAGIGQGSTVGVHAAIITVQPGYTLWGIAKASYGAGILYVKVFQANHDQIRNPDLIYPGQVFSVPGSH